MPNTKISALSESTAPSAASQTIIVDAGTALNAKVTLTNLVKAAIGGNTAVQLGLNAVAKSGAFSDLTGAGTMASQNASGVSITGGTVTGITDLAIADGGTGASTVAAAVNNLGLNYSTFNSGNTLVQRDAAGNFVCGTITGNNFTGKAGTAGTADLATLATTATSAGKSTNLASGVSGSIPYQTGPNLTGFTAQGADTQILMSKGAAMPVWVAQTSIASGLAPTSQNYVWAGPAAGGAGNSAARPLVAADIPAGINITGTAAGLSTTLVATSGGTGQTGYAIGDLLYANSATTLAKLTDIAVGSVLRSGGIGAIPAYGKVVLTTDVSGALPLANGGTGATSASDALTALLPSQATAAGKTLQSDGTSALWVAGSGSGTLTSFKVENLLNGIAITPTNTVTSGQVVLGLSGTLAVKNGGTGAITEGAALTALGGQPLATTLTQLSSVSAATDQLPYFSSASAFANTPLTKVARDFLAITTQPLQSSYIAATAPFSTVALDPCGRLSSLSNNADNPADNPNITQLFYVPYKGNVVMLWNGSSWVNRTLTTITIPLTGLAAKMGYDVFIYWDSGTSAVVAQTVAWTAVGTVRQNSDNSTSSSNPLNYATTRTALAVRDSRYVQSADNTRLYVGSFHTTNTTGQTADTPSQRLVANQYNRIRKSVLGKATNSCFYYGTHYTTTGQSGAGISLTMHPDYGTAWTMCAVNTEVSINVSAYVVYNGTEGSQYAYYLWLATHMAYPKVPVTTVAASPATYATGILMNYQGGSLDFASCGGVYSPKTDSYSFSPAYVACLSDGLKGWQPYIRKEGTVSIDDVIGPRVSGSVNC